MANFLTGLGRVLTAAGTGGQSLERERALQQQQQQFLAQQALEEQARQQQLQQQAAQQQAFASQFPQFAGISGQLTPELIQSGLQQGLRQGIAQQFAPPPAPVSSQGKLLQDVRRGLVPKEIAERKLASQEPILVGQEINEIPDLNERADFLQTIAEQNIALGNAKVGAQQAQQAREFKKEFREIEKDTQKLSSTLDKSGIPSLVDSLEDITSIINESPSDIPGVGGTAFLPDIAVSGQGKRLRQSIGTLRNSILKARSGGAVTPQEADRLLAELGLGIGRTDEQLKIGVQNVIDGFNEVLTNIKGGFKPEAVNLLSERGGSDIFGRLSSLKINQPATRQQFTQQQILDEVRRRGLGQ